MRFPVSISPRGSGAFTSAISGVRRRRCPGSAPRRRRRRRSGASCRSSCASSARKSLLDAPCGDGGWIGRTDLGVAYTGIDIVPELIEALAAKADNSGRTYELADLTRDALPKADAVLCRDCLVHFSFATIGRAVSNLRRSGARFLITTSFTDLEQNKDCDDADWRPLNFERTPFSWGRPAFLLNEGCVEDGGLWADKSLGVWQLDSIA